MVILKSYLYKAGLHITGTQAMLFASLLTLLSFTAASNSNKIDLGAGNFLKTVCAPYHPTSLSGQSDYVCTLKERDFYPESIVNAVLGLDIMATADMVKNLQVFLARNLLNLKRKGTAEELEAYKEAVGGKDQFQNLVWFMIQGGWDTETFDHGFELYEEFEHDLNSTLVLVNQATPTKLIQRLAQKKPQLAVKLLSNFDPAEKPTVMLNDPTGTVFDSFIGHLKEPKANLASMYNEYMSHFCQKVPKENIHMITQKLGLIADIYDEKSIKREANSIRAINEICFGSDEKKAIGVYEQYKDSINIPAFHVNNYKTTLEILKLENDTEILKFLDLFSNEEDVILALSFISSSDDGQLLSRVIENALESTDSRAGTILTQAINKLESPVTVRLRIKGFGKLLVNPDIKNTVLEKANLLKFKCTGSALATLIKDDHLPSFVKEFRDAMDSFEVDRPDVVLVHLNRAEDFNAAYNFFKLKQGDDLDQIDFFTTNLNRALDIFPGSHQAGSLGEQYSQIFLMMRRAQVEHLISKFKADFLPKVPDVFSEMLEKTQEL